MGPGWWFFTNPSEKYAQSSKLDHETPGIGRGEHETIFEVATTEKYTVRNLVHLNSGDSIRDLLIFQLEVI